MKKTLIFLAIFALLTGYRPMFAADPSNNLLLPKDCSLTTEKLTPLWKASLIGNIAFMPQQASDGMLLVATDKSMAVINSNTGQLVWETKIQDGCKWNAVLTSNSSVCVVKTDEVVCLSIVNGSTIWSKRFGENITAQPVSNGENLYVVTGKEISAIDSAKGNLLWKREFKGFVNVTPCLANGNLFLSSLDGYCAALDARDGALEWESKPGEQPTDALVAYGKNIYMVCEKSLFSLDNATGKPIWKFVAKSKGFSPTVTDDALLYPTADKTLYCLDPKTCGKGCCLSTPKQLWQLNKNSAIIRRIAVSGKHAYLATVDGWVQVIEILKGDLVSKHEIGMDLTDSVYLAGQVVVPFGKSVKSFANLPAKIEIFLDKTYVNRDQFQIKVEVGAKLINGKSMIPAIYALEPFGGSAQWDAKTKTMFCSFNGKKLEARIGSDLVTIDGKQIKLDSNPKVTPAIVSGRVMVPARFFGETFMDLTVNWIEKEKSFELKRWNK